MIDSLVMRGRMPTRVALAREVIFWPLVALILITLLSGCAWFKPAKYDSTEFSVYADIWQNAARLGERCGMPREEARAKAALEISAERASLFGRFGVYTDSKTYAAALGRMVEEFEPGGSGEYCRASAALIQAATERVMRQLARRER